MNWQERVGEVCIDGPDGVLQLVVASADRVDSSSVAVICHPHPLHGGTMDNKVVTTLERAYRALGIRTVKFNFRGVGKSQGAFDHAKGELEDLLTVVQWVNAQTTVKKLYLAGFSFGSAVAASASHKLRDIEHLLLVAPPIERYRFDLESLFPCSASVIQGGADERVNPLGVYAWANTIKSPLNLVRMSAAGHFFHGNLSALKAEVIAQLQD